MKNLFDVSGKVALVTGGATGIGKMIAEGLVANGVRVYIAGRRLEKAQETANELAEFGDCRAVQGDVETVEGIEALAKDMEGLEDHLDILVNNAGVATAGAIGAFKERGWDKVMDINTKAPFFLSQALLPLLEKNADKEDPARIINIASIDGMRVPAFDTYSYTVSKAAVRQLTAIMASRLGRKHITVNSICPGGFPSEMMDDTMDMVGDKIIESIPRGRMGTKEDMAGTVIYLCSRAGAWTTGAEIAVDGGDLVHNSGPRLM